MFAVHGDLAHVKVVYDRTTGKSMGYGFVKFTTNEAAAAATNAINGMAIDRKRIKVKNMYSLSLLRFSPWEILRCFLACCATAGRMYERLMPKFLVDWVVPWVSHRRSIITVEVLACPGSIS